MNKDFFTRGVSEIINEKSLKEKLNLSVGGGKKLRIKYGVDPTRPDIHLGHAVSMWKLKELQDAGHTIIFLIGDYTTKIGDPSGRNTTRPVLSDEEIKENAKTYFEQVGKILDVSKTEIRYNSEWYEKMDFNDILQIAGKFTVAQIIERDDFEKRLKNKTDIGLHELFYPLMQAYDSVVLEANVEFGGNDQKFNMLAGRDLQKKMGQTPQDIFITKLLVGLDGKVKMSKSADNYIAITESADSMFGKIMSIPDEAMEMYFELCTHLSDEEIIKIKKKLKDGTNPRDIKAYLAERIVEIYHGKDESKRAMEEFFKIFSKKELPTDIPKLSLEGTFSMILLLKELGVCGSNSEAKRLVEQGAIKIDGAKFTDSNAEITTHSGMVIQVGRKKFYKIK